MTDWNRLADRCLAGESPCRAGALAVLKGLDDEWLGVIPETCP